MAEFPAPERSEQRLSSDDQLRRLYDETWVIVYGYFLRRTRRAEVARDLTQDTFASALASLRGGADVKSPQPWIVSIARRRLVDHWRRQDRDRRRIERATALVDRAPPHGSETGPDARVHAALATISSSHRTALVLRYVDGLSAAEVGRHLGRSERAAESLLVRARGAFAKSFEEANDA